MAVKYLVLYGAVEIVAGENDQFRVTENATTATATIAPGTYYLLNDGSADDLCKAFLDALEAATASVNTYTISLAISIDPADLSASIRISRASGADTFALLWADALTTFDEALFGFTNANTANSAAAKQGTKSPTCVWVPNDVPGDIELDAGAQAAEVEIADGDYDIERTSDERQSILITFEDIDGDRVKRHLNTTDPAASLQEFLRLHGDGRELMVLEHEISSGLFLEAPSLADEVLEDGDLWRFSAETIQAFRPFRRNRGLELFDFVLLLRRVVD